MPYDIDHVETRALKPSLIRDVERFRKMPAQLVGPECRKNMYTFAEHNHTGMQRKYGLILCNI